MKWRKVAATLASVALSSILTGVPAHADSTYECVAHKGYYGDTARGNTVESVLAVQGKDVYRVEGDVQFTSTGYPVISHTKYLYGDDPNHLIRDQTVTQVTSYTIPGSGGLHPPTMYAWLHAMDQVGVRGLVELKSTPTADEWNKLLTKIPAAMYDRIVFQSFQSAAVYGAMNRGFAAIRLLNWHYTSSWITNYNRGIAVDRTSFASVADETAYVNKVRSMGQQVWFWTAQDATQTQDDAGTGAKGVITNDVDACP